MRLTDALALSDVPRWCIVAHLKPQSVGDHVYRTLVIFTQLCARLDLEPNVEDLINVLYHDLDESQTGDIPTPAKERAGIPEVQLFWSDPAMYRAFRLADLIEAYTFIERYGVGEHSRRVAASMRLKISESIGPLHLVWTPIVNSLIDAIAFDQER